MKDPPPSRRRCAQPELVQGLQGCQGSWGVSTGVREQAEPGIENSGALEPWLHRMNHSHIFFPSQQDSVSLTNQIDGSTCGLPCQDISSRPVWFS